MFHPALFQCAHGFNSGTSYKDPVGWRPGMADVFKWMIQRGDDNTIIAATDARNPKIRFQLQPIVGETQKDEQKYLETHIIYKGQPHKSGFRFPGRRKVCGALHNMETVVGSLPVSRVRMRTRSRATFSAGGESSTHTMSYSGVHWRTLSSLPRMAVDVKEAVTGITAPVSDELVFKETKTRGHPLFWMEILDVEWHITFFRDTHVTHVLDVSPGSGAAACAAAVLNISYEGIAMSAKHAAWLDNIMDKAVFAAVQLRGIEKDAKGKAVDSDAKQLQDNVLAFFKDLVEEGRKYLTRDSHQPEDDDLIDDADDDDEGESKQ